MITFNYETDFELDKPERTETWIRKIVKTEGFELGELHYVFCDDEYLYNLNVEFLQHDTFTDIISFDYTTGNVVSGDVYISVDRVKDNSDEYNVPFEEELHRVIIHGVLHFFGLKDKTKEEKKIMRDKENKCLLKLNN